MKEVERRLAEVELDRTLCMNRIAQLEEELDTLKEAKADALTGMYMRACILTLALTLSRRRQAQLGVPRPRSCLLTYLLTY